MTGHNCNLRLDQILLEEGLVTNDQIIEALHYQKEHGGKLGSHLMRFGYVDESGLVQALARQYGCEGIVLTDLDIAGIIVKFIPAKIALARRVIPFDYNPEKNLLFVACPDPSDRYLIDELNFVARGKKVKLFIAVEQALKQAIDHYYKTDMNLTGETALEEFNQAKDREAEKNNAEADGTLPAPAGRLLVVGGDKAEQRAIQSLFEASNWRVQTVNSGDRVPAYLDVGRFNQVIIKKTDSEAMDSLRRQLRMRPSKTRLRTFEKLTDLIDEPSNELQADLLIENLDLFALMLGSKDKVKVNRSSTVGRYTNELCGRLNLTGQERAVITSAAYLHDLARYYYDQGENEADETDVLKLTIKLLRSLNYSPEVIKVLESVHKEFSSEEEIRLSLIGGSIITAVSEMVEVIPIDEKISSEKLASFQIWLGELTGKKVISRVAKTLLEMIEEKMLAGATDDRFSHVLILGESEAKLDRIVERLKRESFHPTVEQTETGFVSLYQRGVPDMIILLEHDDPGHLKAMVDRLFDQGVELSAVPTFVLSESVTSQLSALLEKGIEDIVPMGDGLNMLAAKMNRIRARVKATEDSRRISASSGQGPVTQGQVSDMNLIELLQVLGMSRKTAHLSIVSPEGELSVCLHDGEIIHARCGDMVGVEAVHMGIRWTTGTWTMNNVDESDLPKRNVHETNELIIMEGCRLLDESTRIEVHSGGVTPN